MRRLLVLALILSASACDSGGPGFTGLDGLSQDASLLVGTWEWERSYFCSLGSEGCTETTPRSAGQSETLTFSVEGTVSGYFNGFTIGATAPETYRVDGFDVVIGESRGGTEFGVSRDRLVITDAALDGSETTYRRAR